MGLAGPRWQPMQHGNQQASQYPIQNANENASQRATGARLNSPLLSKRMLPKAGPPILPRSS